MIKITLLLCLIAVCLSERDEYSYGKINTIELRSNEDNELIDNSNEDHDLDYEKRYILSVTGDLKTCDQEVAQLTRETIETIQSLLDLLEDDGKGIIVSLQGILAGLLAAVLNLVASLLALIGSLLGGIINSLISLNTNLTGNINQLNGVIVTINSQLTHVILGVVGQVTHITDALTPIITNLTAKLACLTEILPLITDLTLKNKVQGLITEITTLTTGLGQLVGQLVSIVLALVQQILLALAPALDIVDLLITDLTAGKALQIEKITNLNAILENLKGLLNELVGKLADVPAGILLRPLLKVLIDFVQNTLMQLITLLNALPVTPEITTLITHQGDLTEIIALIP